MIAGRFAFQGLSEYLTLEKIKSMQYSFPEGFDEEAKDLVSKLLVRNQNFQCYLGISPQPPLTFKTIQLCIHLLTHSPLFIDA